jgi:nicotinamide-nucleotide amidase
MENSSVMASIITIGDELLIGQVIDTNSAWMAVELNKAGVWLKRRVAVGDNREDILYALDEESKSSSIILITGGLGPTADDITKPVLCEYFGGRLVIDEGALRNVQEIFARLNRPMIERNLKQAEVPDVCTVIQNKRGTAPGMWFEKDGRIFISMPGVPHEMKGMMTDTALPALARHFKMPFIISRTLLTAGVGESFLAELIQDFEEGLPSHIRLAYLPNYGMVRLRLTGSGTSKSEIETAVEGHFTALKKILHEHLVTGEDETMQQVVSRLLKSNNKTLGAAESCTGGYISHLLTFEPGASRFFKGGVVSYSNEVKQNVILVKEQTLRTSGAVSEETVREMASGVLEVLKTDYTVAVSGIMGPDGGSAEKPVGLVWMAVGSSSGIITQKFNLRYDRQRNIELTANYALNLLRKFILSEIPDETAVERK